MSDRKVYITDDISVNDSGVAASSVAVKNLNDTIRSEISNIDVGVTSVNGMTGDVTGFVRSVNGTSADDTGNAYLGGGVSLPGSKITNLTLGASFSSYTAPADGWFTLSRGGNAAGQFVSLGNASNDINTLCVMASAGQLDLAVFIPARKGDRVVAGYANGTTAKHFNFIYAEGENV